MAAPTEVLGGENDVAAGVGSGRGCERDRQQKKKKHAGMPD
jgi:hypothetical protein